MKNKATHILTKIAVNIGRLLMAITFIFSGFVKGIDPLGTQYKITDYLEALHIDWMFPSWSTLLMSIVLAMFEFAIGIFLLLAIRRKLISKIALLVMSVMTLITLWIVISEYCDKCHIEPTFIDMLCESGLIDVEQEGGERYLPFSELPDVERYSRMYYDLSINMEGIDAIHHLLARMEEMQREIHSLRGRLRLHGEY